MTTFNTYNLLSHHNNLEDRHNYPYFIDIERETQEIRTLPLNRESRNSNPSGPAYKAPLETPLKHCLFFSRLLSP